MLDWCRGKYLIDGLMSWRGGWSALTAETGAICPPLKWALGLAGVSEPCKRTGLWELMFSNRKKTSG